MTRRRFAQKAGGGKTTRAISGRDEQGAEPIEAAPRSKPPEPEDTAGPSSAPRFAAGLYIVATPIGHLRDISLRALDILAAANVVACEDTRVTAKLMARYGLKAPLLAYHEHNAERMRPLLLERLKAGAVMALVADAGTPLVSDPGFKLVRTAIAEGIAVTAVPGPSAALAALVLSGLPSDRFFFQGFLPAKEAARRRVAAELARVPATLIVYETAPRLAASLADLAAILGPRPAAVARELTKLHEEIRHGGLDALAVHYAAAAAPKGEIVIVIGGAAEAESAATTDEALDAALDQALATMSLKDASEAVAAATGRPRREVYQRALILTGRSA
jgi:16S rRNA (cytidine1402-2'-O)-methyltransferase